MTFQMTPKERAKALLDDIINECVTVDDHEDFIDLVHLEILLRREFEELEEQPNDYHIGFEDGYNKAKEENDVS